MILKSLTSRHKLRVARRRASVVQEASGAARQVGRAGKGIRLPLLRRALIARPSPRDGIPHRVLLPTVNARRSLPVPAPVLHQRADGAAGAVGAENLGPLVLRDYLTELTFQVGRL